MSRPLSTAILYLCVFSVFAASPVLTVPQLSALDRRSLEATVRGDVLALEPMLAPDFQAVLQVPTGNGNEIQTLRFGRTEFLLYAWQAASLAEEYRVTPKPAEYRITEDGRSALGTQLLEERLRWNGQPLGYSSRRNTHYRVSQGKVLITRLEVKVLRWSGG